MPSTAVAVTTTLQSLAGQLAERLSIGGDPNELVTTLKQTAFRGKDEVSDAQLQALLVVAQEYGLNPFTKELYAFPSERGIVPIVSVDGWIRIVNEHPMFDGIDFDMPPDGAYAKCRIHRKDREKPIEITEYLVECKRETDPWRRWPKRMLRHKALIQCARVAFGFAAYDEDEGIHVAGLVIDAETGEVVQPPERGPKRKSTAKAHSAAAGSATDATETKPPAGDAKAAGGETNGAAAGAPAAAAAAAPSPAPGTAPASSTAANGAGAIKGNEVAYLRNKLKALDIAEKTICDRFTVPSIEHLSREQFDTLKAELIAQG